MGARITRTRVGFQDRVGFAALVLVLLVAAGCTIVTYPSPGRTVDPSNPLTAPVLAHPIGTFTLPPEPLTGEGKLQLQMSAPRNQLGRRREHVGRRRGGNRQRPAADLPVLFAGAAPYLYTGFTGPLTTGSHDVVVSVRPDLSLTTGTPTAPACRASSSW